MECEVGALCPGDSCKPLDPEGISARMSPSGTLASLNGQSDLVHTLPQPARPCMVTSLTTSFHPPPFSLHPPLGPSIPQKATGSPPQGLGPCCSFPKFCPRPAPSHHSAVSSYPLNGRASWAGCRSFSLNLCAKFRRCHHLSFPVGHSPWRGRGGGGDLLLAHW